MYDTKSCRGCIYLRWTDIIRILLKEMLTIQTDTGDAVVVDMWRLPNVVCLAYLNLLGSDCEPKTLLKGQLTNKKLHKTLSVLLCQMILLALLKRMVKIVYEDLILNYFVGMIMESNDGQWFNFKS